MLKDILEVIFFIIIISFVWRLIKRLFFGAIAKNFQQKNQSYNPQNNTTTTYPKDSKKNQNLHWDAETVDYEEIKEPKDQSN